MASGITLSAGVRQNLLSLQDTASLMATTQNRLATGKKVNSALDNPTNFFTAQSLQSRAGDLNSLLDSMSNGKKTLEAADNGLTAITRTVESMQATLRQARQDKSFKNESLTLDPARTGNLSFSGGSVGSTAVNVALANGTGSPTAGSITGGTFTAMNFVPASATAGQVAGTTFGAAMNFTVTPPTAGTNTLTFGSSQAFDTDDAITFDIVVDGGSTQSITIAQADVAAVGNTDNTLDSADELVSIINSKITGATAANNSGTITITSGTTGASSSVQISNTAISDVNTSGFANTTGIANGAGTAGGAGATPQMTFSVTVDGGSTQNITIAAADVAAVGDNDNTLDDAAELVSILNSKITGATATQSSGVITLASSTTGASSSVQIASTAVTGGISNTSGFANGSNTGTAAGAAKTLSFSVTADGGTAQPVTIDLAAVQAAGNNDGTIDSVSELASIIDAQLGASVTVNGSGSTLVLSSATTGTASSLAISGVTASGITNTSGVANTTTTSGTAGAVLKSVDTLVSEINSNSSLKDKILASNDNGKLRIQNLSTADLSIGGLDASGNVTGGSSTKTVGANEVRKNLVAQFNELRNQLDKLADDASFNGINLLRGDKLKLNLNETGTNMIEIQAKDSTGAATSVSSAKLDITAAVDADFDSDAGIDARLDGLSNSLGRLRSQASSFGSNLSIVQNRTDFTKSMINTLQTGADSLVLADTNEEAANMLALQTRQQLSSTALSLASQADQAALRLF